jgi:hypothetical protein
VSSKILTAACIAAQVILLAVSFNGLGATLGWGVSIESPIRFDAHERSTTAWAPVFMVCWLLAESAVLILLLEQLARHKRRAPWLRMPSLGGLSETPGSRFGLRLHQALILFVVIGPLYSGGHFLLKTLSASVVCENGARINTLADHFVGVGSANTRCWLDGAEHGVEYFPRWEAWIFCFSFISVAALWGYVLRDLARSNNPVSPSR